MDHSWCDNGPGWQALLLDSAERVLAVVPDPQILAGLDVGIVGPHSPGDAAGATADFEVRAFFPGNTGLTEDPVTGSLNAALAQWLIEAGHAPAEYTAAQGTAMGRAGRVRIQQDGPEVWVGGQCVTVITGTVDEVVYQWPNGWSRMAVAHGDTLNSLLAPNITVITSEYRWPVLLN